VEAIDGSFLVLLRKEYRKVLPAPTEPGVVSGYEVSPSKTNLVKEEGYLSRHHVAGLSINEDIDWCDEIRLVSVHQTRRDFQTAKPGLA
jgi:hypothetical protein